MLPFLFSTRPDALDALDGWHPCPLSAGDATALRNTLDATPEALKAIENGGYCWFPENASGWLPFVMDQTTLSSALPGDQGAAGIQQKKIQYKQLFIEKNAIFDEIQSALHQFTWRQNCQWQIGNHRTLSLSFPQIMGIWNISTDSFSSEENSHTHGHAEQLCRDGADILDIGAESTRPGAAPLTAAEEIDRLRHNLPWALHTLHIPVSVDTYRQATAEYAIEAGAHIINDIGWRETIPEDKKLFKNNILQLGDIYKDYTLFRRYFEPTLSMLVHSGAGYVLTFTRPHDADEMPYFQLLMEMIDFFELCLREMWERGIDLRRIVLDPGIGFGKGMQNDCRLLEAAASLQILGRPVLIGHSRKRCLGFYTGRAVDHREAATVAGSVLALRTGAKILRVHEPTGTCDARAMCILNQSPAIIQTSLPQ